MASNGEPKLRRGGSAGPAPGGDREPAATGPARQGRTITARALRHLVLAGVLILTAAGGAGLTWASETGWAALVVAALGLWSGWLYWRTVVGSRDCPGHALHPFLAGTILILLAGLLARGNLDPHAGKVKLFGDGDVSVLTRLMTLALLVLLVQDVLSRVHRLRWLLSALGLLLAGGAVLRLLLSRGVPGAQAVGLAGFAGVGVLLTPCLLPDWPEQRLCGLVPDSVRRLGLVVRTALAGLLGALLIVGHPKSAQGGIMAAGAAGGALLLAGGVLRHHRARLLAIGAALVAGSAAATWRMKFAAPGWLGQITPWGSGTSPADPSASGLWVLMSSAGWVGAALIAAGMLLALVRSLWACRRADVGDQARAALWAAVVAVAGCAVFAEGGLRVPSAAVGAAVALGLMPHMMAHRVRRFHGLAAVAAFAAALLVLGLEQIVGRSAWSVLAARYGHGMMHCFGTFVLGAVLLWQSGSRRWWQGVCCAAGAGAIAAAGELAQKYLSTRSAEWSDVGWDFLGAAAALAVFLGVSALLWIERHFAVGHKLAAEKYEPWRDLPGTD